MKKLSLMDAYFNSLQYDKNNIYKNSAIHTTLRSRYLDSTNDTLERNCKEIRHFSHNSFYHMTIPIAAIENLKICDETNHIYINNKTERKALKMNIDKKYQTAIINYVKGRIKDKFGYNIDLNLDHNRKTLKFLSWLKRYDKNFKNHIDISYCRGNERRYYLKRDIEMLLKIDARTYAYITAGKANLKNLTEYEIANGLGDPNTVKIYVFGKNATKVKYSIEKIAREGSRLSVENFSVSAGKKSDDPLIFRNFLKNRNENSVFLNNDLKEKIFNYIDNFFLNKNMYLDRQLKLKTGILLHGEPGTGKSTLAHVIATKYNCSLITINMTEFADININSLTSMIDADDNTYIILLEDIDCVIGNRETDDDTESKKNVNKLLQFLDSNSSPNNVIFIATTNHIEKLDSAICRDGRFDLTVKIDNFKIDTARKMCLSFGMKKDEIDTFLDKHVDSDRKINPSRLQNLLLQKLKPINKEENKNE